MRKLSETLIEEQQKIDRGTLSSNHTLSLVLFDNVLDPEKVLRSPEIEILVKFVYGRSILSVIQVENPEKLQDWFRDEQYKADVQNRAMTYPFKADFEELTLNTYSDQYGYPLFAQMFSSSDNSFDVITITCHWSDGLYTNEYYVVGAIAETEDMEKILEH